MEKAAQGLNPTPQSLDVYPSLLGALSPLLAVLTAMKAFGRWRDQSWVSILHVYQGTRVQLTKQWRIDLLRDNPRSKR